MGKADRSRSRSAEWVDWFNNRQLLKPIGDIPPAEYETMYYRPFEELAMVAWLKQPSLRNTRGGSNQAILYM
jgi:hypothetical protein